MKFDHHNGKSVESIQDNSVLLNDGTAIEVQSVIPDDVVGAVLLQVVDGNDGVHYLHFGHPQRDQAGNPLPPRVVAILDGAVTYSEATE